MDKTSHWNNAYCNATTEKLGWYEENSTPTLELIHKIPLPKNATILNVGVGSSTIIDDLLSEGYSNLIANDLSSESLKLLKKRIGKASDKVQFIVDDLINATQLNTLLPVDVWNDRAVLHFFTKNEEQNTYFKLLKKLVKPSGYVILAEFSLNGAKKCSGLEVFRYDANMLQERLGVEFKLITSFDYVFLNPNGDERPYIYTLFQRIDENN